MRRSTLLLVAIFLALFCIAFLTAQTAPAAKAKAAAPSAPAQVDRAYLQSIWDGWASADLEKQGQFYVHGPNHLFFDVAPLKYNSWEEYKAGVAPSLKNAPKVTFTLNDDLQIHPEGSITWVDGTLTMQGTSPQGTAEKLALRWTAVLKQQDGRWLIEHEHISVPAEVPQ